MTAPQHLSETANADLLTAVADIDGVTARIEQVELSGHPLVVVVRTSEIAEDGSDPPTRLLLGDATDDGLGFDWSAVSSEHDGWSHEEWVAQGAFTAAAVPPPVTEVPSYKAAVRAGVYLADGELRAELRDAAVRVTQAFLADQPDALAGIPHVQLG